MTNVVTKTERQSLKLEAQRCRRISATISATNLVIRALTRPSQRSVQSIFVAHAHGSIAQASDRWRALIASLLLTMRVTGGATAKESGAKSREET